MLIVFTTINDRNLNLPVNFRLKQTLYVRKVYDEVDSPKYENEFKNKAKFPLLRKIRLIRL